MIHYMLLLGYILVTCHKNNIVTLHVTFMLYRRNKTCLLGNYRKTCRSSRGRRKTPSGHGSPRRQ